MGNCEGKGSDRKSMADMDALNEHLATKAALNQQNMAPIAMPIQMKTAEVNDE